MAVARKIEGFVGTLRLMVELKNKEVILTLEDIVKFIKSCAIYFNHLEIIELGTPDNEILKFMFESQIKLHITANAGDDFFETMQNLESLVDENWKWAMTEISAKKELYLLESYKLLEENDKKMFIEILTEILAVLFNSEEVEEVIGLYQKNMKKEDIATWEMNNIQKTLEEKFKDIIGLGNIKKDIYELLNFITVNKRREASGLKANKISKHMAFLGNPR